MIGDTREQPQFWNFVVPAIAALAAGALGSKGQRDANESNIQLGREQMDFQEKMSNTAYQRAVRDMQAAGLSPMLAYSQGGASQPPGSMPQVQNVLGAGVSSAMQSMQTISGIQQMQLSAAQAQQTLAQTKKIESETMDRDLNTAMRAAEVGTQQWEEQKRAGESRTAWSESKIRREMADVSKRVQSAATAKLEAESARETGSFEADVRRRKAEASLRELEIPAAKAGATFATDTEAMPKYLRMLLDVLRGVHSARGLRD